MTETKNVNLREIALEVLLELSRGEEYSHILLRSVLEKYQYLEKRDRAFLTRLIEGTLERRIELDYVIDSYSSVKVRKQKPVIRELLRLSVYQLLYMDSVPDSAVCNEAVKLAKKKGFRNLTGFVNGVLRSIARGRESLAYPPETKTAEYLSVRYSMPRWIVGDWLTAYGEETTRRLLEAVYQERPLSIRVNTARITRENLAERLQTQGVETEAAPYAKTALYLKKYDHLTAIPEFREGLFQVQDVSSQLAVQIAGIEPGMRCIDVCAAPGGKALHMAALAGKTGSVLARDLTEYKADQIRDNAKRLGTENLEVSVWDARIPDESLAGTADVVLADLPCSGLGVMNKKTDLKYRMTRQQEEELAALQREILTAVQGYVKPGGLLIYSTCTIDSLENEDNYRWFLEHYPFEPVDFRPELPESLQASTAAEGYLQLLPGLHECDGFFIAKFRKNEVQR